MTDLLGYRYILPAAEHAILWAILQSTFDETDDNLDEKDCYTEPEENLADENKNSPYRSYSRQQGHEEDASYPQDEAGA